jgi:hypothetical protein
MPPRGYNMTAKAGRILYTEFVAKGWNDEQLVAEGYMEREPDARIWHPLQVLDDGMYPENWWEWLAKNEAVWETFIKYSLEARARRSRYSASAIVERMRWDHDLHEVSKFKISNNARKGLARLAMAAYPELHGFFKTHNRGNHVATDLVTGEELPEDNKSGDDWEHHS